MLQYAPYGQTNNKTNRNNNVEQQDNWNWRSSAVPAFTPEKVQSILDARGFRPPFFLSLFYLDPAKFYLESIADGLNAVHARYLPVRALTNDEIGALADDMAESITTALAHRPASMAVALFLTWRGHARFCFPFWQPKWVNTSPDVFPSLRSPFLHNKAARVAWHTSRLATYGALSYLVVPAFFGAYVQLKGTRDIANDPRLQALFEEIGAGHEDMH